MKKIIYHDLKILQNMIIGFFLCSLIAGSFFFTPEGSVYLPGFLFTAFLFQILHFNLEKNKSENILVSFPITRKQVVLARYVTAFIITLINTLTSACVLAIQHLLEPSRPYPEFNYAIFTFVISLFYLFLYLPFYFRFGYNKSIWISIILIIILTPAFVLVQAMMMLSDAEITPKEFVTQEQLWFILGSIVLITIILGFISVWCSIRLYRKREF